MSGSIAKRATHLTSAFSLETLRPLPLLLPDCRDTTEAFVHKDLRLSFDGNRYSVSARYVGRKLTVKADAYAVAVYDQHQEVVRYARSWQRGQTFGAKRFLKELFAQLAAAARPAAQQRLIKLLGPDSEHYLRRLADKDGTLSQQVRELFTLIREYGPDAAASALIKDMSHALSEPTISPISFASSKCDAMFSRHCC